MKVAPRFDPETALADGAYESYATLRAAGRVVRGGVGQVVVTRYDDVARLLRDPRLSNEFPEEYLEFAVGTGPACEFLRRIVLHRDLAVHHALRGAMRRSFSPLALERLRPSLVAIVDDLLDHIAARPVFDAVHDLAAALPWRVICELMAIEPTDADEAAIRGDVADVGLAFSLMVSPADRMKADAAVERLRAVFGPLVDRRRRRPGPDVLSALASSEAGGFSRDDAVDNAVFLLFASLETTTSMLATGCAVLAGQPDIFRRLRRDPSLVGSFRDEIVRLDAPIQSRARRVVEPVEIDGREVRPGRVVVLLLGSANHDERAFTAPDRCVPDRRPNLHVGFGGGIHRCIGAPLAGLEGELVFGGLTARFESLRLAGDCVRQPATVFRSYASVPIRGTPAKSVATAVKTKPSATA